MTDIKLPKNYAESRTGRGDEWYEKMRSLEKRADELDKVATYFQNYTDLVKGAYSTLPLDHLRRLVKDAIIEFCEEQEIVARRTALRHRNRQKDLENAGVEDV